MFRSFVRLACLLAAAVVVRADTVVVLPMFNLSKQVPLDWVGESIAETVREALAAEGMLVLPRDERQQAFQRLGIRPYTLLTRASVVKLGEAVDADQVVYGSFQFTPPDGEAPQIKGSLRIVAQVIDLKHMTRSREFTEIGALEDLARLQSHLAWQALHFLQPRTALSEDEYQLRQRVVRVDAMENYVRGLLAGNPDQRQRLFTQAARLDANFPQPLLQLGKLYMQRKNYRAAADWLQRMNPNDPDFREAHYLLGVCRYYLADYAGAAKAFALIAQSMPLNEVLNNLGAAQSRANQPEALENLRRALEGDPADADYQFNVGYLLWRRGDFAGAAERFRAVLQRKPSDQQAKMLLERAQQQSGSRGMEARTSNLERIKENYEETAYRQLKTLLEPASR